MRFYVAAAMVALAVLGGCSSSSDDATPAGGAGATCQDGVATGKCTKVQACAANNAVYYIVQPGDKTFPCAGNDCTQAAKDMVAYCTQ